MNQQGDGRAYDVIIYGATGFTGSLACSYLEHTVLLAIEQEREKSALAFQNQREYLHQKVGEKRVSTLKWAIAGRDGKRLSEMKQSLSTCSGVVVADSSNTPAVEAMAQSTRVLLSFAGPFSLYGTPVVAACVKFGTHYCDSTGEVFWVQQLINQFDSLAKEKKIKIVPMCGFDCIPSDLGVFYAVQKLRELKGVTSVSRAHTFGILQGGMSGGTAASSLLIEKEPASKDPFALGGGPANANHLAAALGNQTEAKLNQDIGHWTAPYMMEALNTRVVRKSAKDWGYHDKNEFYYSESALTKTEAAARKMALPPPSAEVRKKLIEQGKLPKPGEGPSLKTRRASRFQMWIKAEGEGKNDAVWVSVTGGDAGYEDTALMCCESALALALEQESLPQRFGVLTPSVAMGSALVERLQLAGIRFKALNQKPKTFAVL